MLIDALFNTNAPRINTEHRPKYIYLLSYATSVNESTTASSGTRVYSNFELDATSQRMEHLVDILYSPDDLLLFLHELIELIKTPILAAGLLHHLKTLSIKEAKFSGFLKFFASSTIMNLREMKLPK